MSLLMTGVSGDEKKTGNTYSFVQQSTVQGQYTGTTFTISFPGNVTAGNLLILAGGTYPNSITSITDPNATWTKIQTQTQTEFWYAIPTSGGYSSIVANWGVSSKCSLRLLEFHATSTPVLDTSNKTSGTGTTLTGATLTPANSGELFVSFGVGNGPQALTLTWASAIDKGWTGGNFGSCGLAYLINSGSSSQAVTWTMVANTAWWTVSAVFK